MSVFNIPETLTNILGVVIFAGIIYAVVLSIQYFKK